MFGRVMRSINNYFHQNDDIWYNIDGIKLHLGRGHKLPSYQKAFFFYDRFLPFFVKQMSPRGGTVVDVGANVGDTLASLINKTKARFVCIEPNPAFYGLLIENISYMRKADKDRIETCQAFCSKVLGENYGMVGHDGTAHKISIDSKSDIQSAPLPWLLDQMHVPMDDVWLIKVDTDGFDYDVLLGMGNTLVERNPFLFWENTLDEMEIDTNQAYLGYTELGRYLCQKGYTRFFIFDNFGVYIGDGDASFYQDMNEYLRCLCLYDTGKTFFYVDVLACKAENVAEVRQCVEAYRSCKWMNQ